MKRLIALLILLFFMSTNSCLALSELYYFKNIKTSEVEPLVNSSLSTNGYKIVKENPYYAVMESNNDHAIIVLQQSGDNMFYYYQTDKGIKPHKALLKEIKRRNIVCEQSFNKSIISVYDEIAETLKTNQGNEIRYSFKDEQVNNTTASGNTQQTQIQQNKFSGYIAQLSAGTKFNVYLQNAINTASASEGDTIVAVVQDGLMYGNDVIIPQGSLVYGTLKKARSATYGSRSGRVVIVFDKIVTPENQTYLISAEEIDFSVSNEGKLGESAKSAATSAAIGALLGLLFGALAGTDHIGRSVAIGAGVGAGASAISSVAEKGVDAEIPSFTEIELTLTSPLNVSVSR